MENNDLIHENPNNNGSINKNNKGASFITLDTPGFLVSDIKLNTIEFNTLENIETNNNNNNIQPEQELSMETNIEPINQTIDEIEDAIDEFGSNLYSSNNINNDEEVNIEVPVDTASSAVEIQNQQINNELINNPSSIFNIPLISNEVASSTTITTNNNETSNQTDNSALNSKDIAEMAIAGVASTATPIVNNEQNIDFFSFDFSTIKEETTQFEETSVSTSTINNNDDFGFASVIRPSDKEEIIPEQNDRIELTKFLEPKENLIKNPDEVNENDNNVIRINDDSASNTYRNKNNIIKYSLYAFYVLLFFLVIGFGYKIYKNKTDFSLTRNEIILAINSTYQAEIVSNSKLQDNKKYQWSSSNNDIVQVDENGLITSISGGEAIITVQKANNKKTLKVTTVEIAIESITFKKNLITLKVGEEQTLEPIINNDESIVIDLLWESSDNEVVSVDQNGHIVALSEGSAFIYVYDEISGLGGEIAIDVEPTKEDNKNNDDKNNTNDKDKDKDKEDNKKIPVTKIALNKSDTIMQVGEYIIVSAVVRPANATDKKVTWSTSNSKVATVSSSGKIVAKKAGTATITATTSNGKKAEIKITVTEKFINVTSISLNKENATLNVGESVSLSATVLPKDASNKGIIWSSSDESVATVKDGKVTAKKAGTTTITATSKDGNKKAVCTITVKEKEIIAVTDISLDKTEINLEVGDTSKLTATILPKDATYTDVSWSTSDASVATVENGKITAKGAGTTTITATSNNGKTATCKVTVTEKVIEATGVSLNEKQITLKVGETFQLVATIKPDNVSNKTLTWTSSKSSYASVENGLVTAKKAGNTVITVKTANGKKATCSIIIEEEQTTEPEPEPTPETQPEG